jgi:serine phosphatase RsbU (regulator of sigma subunit)
MLKQRTIGQLHQSLLPHGIPQVPGWEVVVYYSPGFWPGGDYYGVLPLPDGRLLLIIADANDLGMASTALAPMVRLVLHSCPISAAVYQAPWPFSDPSCQSPHILLNHLNHVLAENSLDDQFMTAFCGILDPKDGSFLYANAGHPYPRWWRASRRVDQLVSILRSGALPATLKPVPVSENTIGPTLGEDTIRAGMYRAQQRERRAQPPLLKVS